MGKEIEENIKLILEDLCWYAGTLDNSRDGKYILEKLSELEDLLKLRG